MTTTDQPAPAVAATVPPSQPSASPSERPIDPDKLIAFVLRAVGEVGASLNTALVVMGDQLGYYRSMADGRPVTPAELAERTASSEHYAREWLSAQAPVATSTTTRRPAPSRCPPSTPPPWSTRRARSTCPGSSSSRTERSATRPTSWPWSATATGWDGTPTTTTCTWGASGSSAPCTTRT